MKVIYTDDESESLSATFHFCHNYSRSFFIYMYPEEIEGNQDYN